VLFARTAGGGDQDVWMTVVLLELGVIVGLAVYPLLLPAPSLGSPEFLRTVAQVERWREYLTSRYAARRTTSDDAPAD
jgi:hypothetical protein